MHLLRRCGFGERWCSWIFFCISTVKFFMIINGSLEGFFSSSRGLHQGDHLCPLLFVIVMEAFSRMMGKVVLHGGLHGFMVGGKLVAGVSILHLLFADMDQFESLRCLLLCFKVVSSLKINLYWPGGECTKVGRYFRVWYLFLAY